MGHQELQESRSTSGSLVEFDDIADASSNEKQPVITGVFSHQGTRSLFKDEGSINETSKSRIKSNIIPKKHRESKQIKKQFSLYPQVRTNFSRNKNKVPKHDIGSGPFYYEADFKKNAQKKETQFKIRPFLCSICNISVTTETSLNNHMARIHGDMKCIVCDMCDQTFTRETHLLSHRIMCHPKSQLFECKTCCIFFTEENQFLEHQRNGRHGVQLLE